MVTKKIEVVYTGHNKVKKTTIEVGAKHRYTHGGGRSFGDIINKYYNEFISPFYKEIKQYKYYTISDIKIIKSKVKPWYDKLKEDEILIRKDEKNILGAFIETVDGLDKYFEERNSAYLENEKKDQKELFKIENFYLTEEQKNVSIIDEKNMLVIAGAGCGKTTSILGKINYLIKRKDINPKDILVLSFTRASSKELRERIKKIGFENIEVCTFHKLGKDIIEKQIGQRRIIDENSNPLSYVIQILKEKITQKFEVPNDNLSCEKKIWKNDIKKKFDTYFQNQDSWTDYIKSLLKMEAYYADVELFVDEFTDHSLFIEQSKLYDLETIKSCINKYQNKKNTIKSEKVKSIQEAQIANFLFLNGINYEYEKETIFKEPDGHTIILKPDFYLPEYDIYIEHFGVTKEYGEYEARWLDSEDEEKYIEDMEAKRNCYRFNNVNLIETFSEFSKKGILLKELEHRLREKNVHFNPPTTEQVIKHLKALIEMKKMEKLFRFLERYVSLYKSNGYQEEDLDDIYGCLLENYPENKVRTNIFFKIFRPLYISYQSFLENVTYKLGNNEVYKGMLDYNDMILKAIEFIDDGHIKKDYKYIIVDEYQDISSIRNELILAIQEQTNAHVFLCGG